MCEFLKVGKNGGNYLIYVYDPWALGQSGMAGIGMLPAGLGENTAGVDGGWL